MNIKNVGLSTSAFGYAMRKSARPWTLEEFIDFTHSQGFGGVEAPLKRFIPDLNPERLAKLQTMLTERGMFFILDDEAALNAASLRALIPVATQFGSAIIRAKSSDILGYAREKLDMPWSRHVQHCIEVLRELAPQLREAGLRVALENHQDLDSGDLAQIVAAVGADVVGVTFDIGNAFSTGEDPVSFAQKLGPTIVNIHLKDYKIFKSERGFRLARCPLGDGAVDFKAVLPLLRKNSPGAKMVVELGALEAREVALPAPDFAEPEGGDSWQTPFERGAPGEEVTSYEVAELQKSVTYLSTL